ncbi:MAG: PD40 domain-containing protein [Acidimicrobiia bacterium]|nr:PD40 domain-containing protein [Acidimicrobiia bacterium]
MTELASVAAEGTPANGTSKEPTFTQDGRYIAFTTDADNLDPTDQNSDDDVYVRNIKAGSTLRISKPKGGDVEGGGGWGPSTSRAMSPGTRPAPSPPTTPTA